MNFDNIKDYNPLINSCNTCKNLPECEHDLRVRWDFHYDEMCEDFVCDFYRRKNSGSFRRKCRKFKKEKGELNERTEHPGN